MIGHTRTHNKKKRWYFKCPYDTCKSRFRYKRNYIRHIQSHEPKNKVVEPPTPNPQVSESKVINIFNLIKLGPHETLNNELLFNHNHTLVHKEDIPTIAEPTSNPTNSEVPDVFNLINLGIDEILNNEPFNKILVHENPPMFPEPIDIQIKLLFIDTYFSRL